MKYSLFATINVRKLALQRESTYYKTTYRSVYKNPTVNNLYLFIESKDEDADTHFMESVKLYNRVLDNKTVTKEDKRKIQNYLCSELMAVKDLNKARAIIENCNDGNLSAVCNHKLHILENCDRVIRNESKLLKRFFIDRTISENIHEGTRHTVFELCSLIDTYSTISSKAKLNIALENVSYAIFKSGYNIDLNEVCNYIIEYFLTRDAVITDKVYNGYISVLENNEFIDKDSEEVAFIVKSKEDGYNSYATRVMDLAKQCEDSKFNTFIRSIIKMTTEEQASKYIDDAIMFIIDTSTSVTDAKLLLTSIYTIPLIGNISEEFVNYKIEMSKRKVDINKKIGDSISESVKRSLNDGTLLDFAIALSENVHYPSYILDDYYVEETDPIKILEGANDDEMIEDIIKSFKTSNEKSPSRFKNMITRIMTKNPQSIIDGTPEIFSVVRMMLYLGLSAAFPLGPVFGTILFFVDRLVSRHLNIKQAEKLLKYLRTEKANTKKKLEKVSGKEKDNLEEYIKCLDTCIKKVETYITDLDDENEEVNNSDDSDDFDDDDFDMNFESVIESGSLVKSFGQDSIVSMITANTDVEILSSLSTLFDNSFHPEDFYNKVEEVNENRRFDAILNNRGKGTIYLNSGEASLMAKYESARVINNILTEANKEKDAKKNRFNLNNIKMATVVFRQKFKNAQGKEKEFWRNIDIATVNLSRGIEQALTSDRREAIIKGSIIPSFSKCIKYLLAVASAGFIGSFAGAGVVAASITAVGLLGASKILNERERMLLYDEIDTELQVVDKQIQLAENEGDMNQYRFLLNYQKKLQREKFRIKYGIKMSGRSIPEVKRGRD